MVEARYLARQPIFDRARRVVGYELLYRGAEHGPAVVVDDAHATMSVLYGALMELGLDSTVQTAKAWVNVTAELLALGAHRAIDPTRVVLELLESTTPGPEVAAVLEAVAAEGYVVALDDVVPDDARTPLLGHVRIVKLELPAIRPEDLRAEVARMRGRGLVVLVEKIETPEQYVLARDAGADLFQGYFFTRPEVLSSRSAAASTPVVFALLAKVNDPTVDLTELSELVSTDLALSHKVIQAVNSGFTAVRRRVESVHQAVVLLGAQQLGQLVSLLLMAKATSKPDELSRQALVRAEMAAALVELGVGGGVSGRDAAFTVGLLSTIDAFTDTPMAEAAERLGLSEELRGALVERSGGLGELLRLTLGYENDTLDGGALDLPLTEAYTTAVRRADERWLALAPA